MTSYHKTRTFSYSEATALLSTFDVQKDVEDVCQAFAKGFLDLMEKFESVSKMIHTVDLQGLTVPLKARWDIMRRDFCELVWQFRTNAAIISARLKIFCSTILPMTCHRQSGNSRVGDLSRTLQSFMTISSDNANTTRSFVERAIRLSTVVASFQTEFAKFTSINAHLGQKELQNLSMKIHELNLCVRQLSAMNGQLTNPDPTHLIYAVFRLSMPSGRRSTRSKVSHQKLVLVNSMSQVTAAYDSFDQKRSEVAHAIYCTQMCFGKGNNLTNAASAMSMLISDEIMYLESALGLFLGIWARLRTDSCEIYQWLKTPSDVSTPSAVGEYMRTGNTPYATLATALDLCVASMDSSRFTKT